MGPLCKPIERERGMSQGGTERWKERSVWLRFFIYAFATHIFAGFVMLLFFLGDHANK